MVVTKGPLRWITRESIAAHPPVICSAEKAAQDLIIPPCEEVEESFDILPDQITTLDFLGTGECGQVHKGQLTFEVGVVHVFASSALPIHPKPRPTSSRTRRGRWPSRR